MLSYKVCFTEDCFIQVILHCNATKLKFQLSPTTKAGSFHEIFLYSWLSTPIRGQFYNFLWCLVCCQVTTLQKNYKNDLHVKFTCTFIVISWKTNQEKSFLFLDNDKLCGKDMLRVRTVLKKICEIAHVQFSFELGWECPNTAVFWIMKDGSLVTNILSIFICFTCRTSFKMALTIYQKWLTWYTGFLSKRSKICVDLIIQLCSNFASLW